MAVLTRVFPVLAGGLLLQLLAAQAMASPYPGRGENTTEVIEPKEIAEAKKNLCHSTTEYIKTLKFLRESKDFGYREEACRKIAEEVSRGCDGSAERFVQILTLLKTVGLSERKTLTLALEFSAAPPDVQKNFLEIFTKSFLMEFFDYEFPRAMRVAMELSKDYKGDPARARTDFITLVQFCKNSRKLDLPIVFCAEYAEKVAKLSQYYQQGVAKPFLEFYDQLRDQKDFSLDVKSALEVAFGVMKNGPLAASNFLEAFRFASKDFGHDKKKALEFAAKMASRSFIGEKPPLLQLPPSSVSKEPGQKDEKENATSVRTSHVPNTPEKPGAGL
jgi:hypothetical protein